MKNRVKKKRTAFLSFLRVMTIVVGVLVLMVIGFVVWASGAYQPDGVAISAMDGSDKVRVTESRNMVIIEPMLYKNDGERKTGFIFYPGGKVEEDAYAPVLSKIAENGFRVILLRMPLNLAVFHTAAPDAVFPLYRDTDWYIGGHSLGGSMAAIYAYEHMDKVKGLILLGSYPPKGNDFSTSTLPLLSVFGSMDMGIEEILANKVLLPKTAEFVELPGGNHAQIGNYGVQKGDGAASISREDQQGKTIDAIVDFMK